MKTKRIEGIDHSLVLLEKGDVWPTALVECIEMAGLSSGTFRGSAVLRDVEVRSFDSVAGQREVGRRIDGPVEAVMIDGAFGLSRGSLAVTSRCVLAVRDSFGERVSAGCLESARIDGGEILVSGFTNTDIVRTMRADAGVWLFQLEAEIAGNPALPRPREASEIAATFGRGGSTMPAVAGAWAALAEASNSMVPEPIRVIRAAIGRAVQAPKAPQIGSESPQNDRPGMQGAVVEHFAFGEGDVLKDDGEKLHVRFERDGRIRALNMAVLAVTEAGTRRGKPYFKIGKRAM